MSILDELAEISGGKRYEEYVMLCCPFHGDKHPSLIAHEDGFTCLSCNESGSTVDLMRVLKRSSVQPETSYSHGFPWRRWMSQYGSIYKLASVAHATLKDYPDQAYYLKKRGIAKLIQPCRLGWIDGYYTFPITDKKGQFSGLIVRASEFTENALGIRYGTPPGQEPKLYVPSWKRIEKADKIFFPFGIFDCLVLFALGYPVATWSNGKHPDPDSLKLFRKKIIVIPDMNEEEDALIFAAKLGWRGEVKRINYPDKTKDLAGVYERYKKEALLSLL